MPEMTSIPPHHCCMAACSPNIKTDNKSAVNGISPEKAAAVVARHRLIPEYQNRNASAVTNTPYHISASHPCNPSPARRAAGRSKQAGTRQRNMAMKDTSAVFAVGGMAALSSGRALTTATREQTLKNDSHAAAHNTRTLPDTCSVMKHFPGISRP